MSIIFNDFKPSTILGWGSISVLSDSVYLCAFAVMLSMPAPEALEPLAQGGRVQLWVGGTRAGVSSHSIDAQHCIFLVLRLGEGVVKGLGQNGHSDMAVYLFFFKLKMSEALKHQNFPLQRKLQVEQLILLRRE